LHGREENNEKGKEKRKRKISNLATIVNMMHVFKLQLQVDAITFVTMKHA
jgi:hypothetical protein